MVKVDLSTIPPLTNGKVKRYDRAALKALMQQEIQAESNCQGVAKSRQFRFRHIDEVINNIQPMDWLIKEILEAGGLSVLYGAPGSYKSFLALDWALSIATGVPWNNHPVQSGPVFIFIGEGHTGYSRRIKAWMKETGQNLFDTPVYISERPVQMLDKKSAKDAMNAIQELQKVHGKPLLVLFDTLNRNFGPGDENTTKDMTQFISVLDEMVGNDTARLLVHHTGHMDKQRGRGSSALKGAADAEYQLEKKGDGVTLYCRKMKDAVEFPSMCFEPEIVTVGETQGEPITSLYLAGVDRPTQQSERLSPQMRQAIILLQKLGSEKCIQCLDDWRDFCVQEQVYTRTSFYKAAEKLETRGVITISDGCVTLSPGVSVCIQV